MKTLMIKMALAAAVAVGAGAAIAQDAAPEGATAQPEVVNDGGVEAVRQAEEAAPAEPPKKISNAQDEVTSWVKGKKWKRGWDSKKKRFVQIMADSFDCDDPVKVQNVMLQRDMAAKRVVLMAKRAIIESIKTDVNAEDIVSAMSTPDTPDAEKAELVKTIQTLKQKSVAEFNAEMPLFGATCVRQSESWNKGKYQVAIVLVWSPALERSARAIITGNKAVCKPKENGKSVEEWLETVNPAFMSGPLQFVDADGTRWFLGISARDAEENLDANTLRTNRRLADLSAKQMLAFSLWGDVKSHEINTNILVSTTIDGKSSTEAAEYRELVISQSIKNLPLRGVNQLLSEEVDHPVTGGRIYVSIYGVNQNAAEDMLKVEAVNYATRAELERAKTVERGRAAANKAHVENAKNDPKDFNKGYDAQNGAIQKEVQARKGTQDIQKKESATKRDKQSQAGVFNSGAEADDDDL